MSCDEFTNLLENLKNAKGDINILPKKVSIIGCNEVGICCAVALMRCNVVTEICLIDYFHPGKANAEMLDLECCAPRGITFSSSSAIEDSCASDICVICIDKAAYEGYFVSSDDVDQFTHKLTRQIILKNVDEFKKIVPIIAKRSPNAVLIIATYPSVSMSYISWKHSKFPIHRIIGLGTALNTIEFKTMIANYFDVSPTEVNGYVVGSVRGKIVLWSEVTVSGTPLLDIDPNFSNIVSPEGFYNYAHKKFISQKELYRRKGHPYFSIGALCARLVRAVLTDSEEVFTVSTKNKGFYGLRYNLFMSLPCIIGANGVKTIITPKLNNFEIGKIQKNAEILHKIYIDSYDFI